MLPSVGIEVVEAAGGGAVGGEEELVPAAPHRAGAVSAGVVLDEAGVRAPGAGRLRHHWREVLAVDDLQKEVCVCARVCAT